jgi:hypothetical protein
MAAVSPFSPKTAGSQLPIKCHERCDDRASALDCRLRQAIMLTPKR